MIQFQIQATVVCFVGVPFYSLAQQRTYLRIAICEFILGACELNKLIEKKQKINKRHSHIHAQNTHEIREWVIIMAMAQSFTKKIIKT